MKKLTISVISFAFIAFLASCGGSSQNNNSSSAEDSGNATTTETTAPESGANPSYDPKRGEGKYEDVKVGPFNAALAAKGKVVYNTKCQSCHKLTDERLVGPGWKDITKKHAPAWILNFITNPDAMLDQDPELQKQLEICMVRMPNQNLTDDDAKAVYEFMRENDGAK